jgi:thiol-disulfide isomerase/thioredoxin
MSTTRDRPVALTTAAELDELVATHERVLVEFYTEGCGVCAAMEPVLDGVAGNADVVVATMNPRDDPQLLEAYDVRSVPKLLLFVGGELVATRAEGFLGVDEVLAFVEGATAGDESAGPGQS